MFTNNLFKRLTYKFFTPDLLQRETYESFKRLLEYDRQCHELIADFQDLFYKNDPTEWTRVVVLYNKLSKAVGSMASELTSVSVASATDTHTYYKKFDSYIRFLLETETKPIGLPYIVWLADSRVEPQLAGNKASNLAGIYQNLSCLVPEGFVVTTNSWHALVDFNDLRPEIDSHLLSLDPGNNSSLYHTSQAIMQRIEAAEIPPEVEQDLLHAAQNLSVRVGVNVEPRFAVRSSAVNEDGMNSFAGQYRSMLDVPPEEVCRSYLQILASKYSPNALLYRITAGISDTEASMAVLIIEMIRSRAAGVIYTADSTGEEEDTVFIHSVKGGGEKLVDGKVRPHLHRFEKKSVSLQSQTGSPSPISPDEAQKLARLATDLETFFGTPQDIEWAIRDGEIFILQSRPLRTSLAGKDTGLITKEHDSFRHPVKGTKVQGNRDITSLPLLYHGGITAAQGRATGMVHFLSPENNQLPVPAGAILIVENIPSSLILLLPKCSAVIATGGSVASHFSTICREFEIPLLVAATTIKERLVDGEQITVDADSQKIYRGRDESCITQTGIRQLRANSPYFRRLQPILDFIAPLTILDPESDSFVPESCRSFHDIVRFAHETGIRAMFGIGKSGSRRGQRKRLATTLPFELYLVDVEDDVQTNQATGDTITFDEVVSTPFRALWQGLTHHSVTWGDRLYYNWKEYDSAAMTDGFAFKDNVESASYAVCADDYLNLNIRFGYHFTIVDSLCGENSDQNYCSIRFAGGGGAFEGRYYRLQYIETILRKLGFKVTCKTDLLDGRLESLPADQMAQCLVTVGRMLGTSKLMDMVLKDEESVVFHLDQFFGYDDTFS